MAPLLGLMQMPSALMALLRAALRWALAVALAAVGPGAWAADPPRTPMLRVEAGMHVNLVRAVDVDAAGRWAVTASDDKTARVWDVLGNAAGAVLRVPMAEGIEGRLQAVVITPDGSTVAVAGDTGKAWSGSNAVYIFERASGALLRRIDTRSPASIVTLALSRDGRVLAVGLAGKGGLRTFDFGSGALLGEDGNYADSLYALDFSPDGRRLVAGGADGALRLYNVDAAGRVQLAGGGKPEGSRLIAQARFSPDGKLLAVAFEDNAQVAVLEAADLNLVAQPAAGDARPGAFSSLAWSADGSELWAGGAHRDASQWLLRGWPRSNFATYTDRPVAGASVLAITTLPKQRVLYVSAEPAWGVIDHQARPQLRAQAPVASFNSLARQFGLSADGKRVGFWYAYKQPLFEFELANRALKPIEGAPEGLRNPRTEAPGLDVAAWENQRGTTLNGRRLPLAELETSRSLAIAGDGKSFALGTDERLWSFDAGGKPLWNIRAPAVVWAVNQTADGRLWVTAGQDGALRWYRARDGQEVMALLLHADRRRWVLWTPSGYFEAAAGAEELLGWHLNRRADARPDFFPLRTLRARLYRPDVIDRVLDTADEAEALKQANAAAKRNDEPVQALADSLPPVLELAGGVQVQAAERQARLRLRIRTLADAPVTALRARADGRPAEVQTVGTPSTSAGLEERDVLVRFNGEPGQLQLMAENRNGLSLPAVVALVWPGAPAAPEPLAPPQAAAVSTAMAAVPAAATAAAAAATVAVRPAAGAKPPAADEVKRAPKLYILAIGVGRFADANISPLELTGKDVRDFVAEMKKQQGKLYRGVETRVLIDQQATRDAIMDGLEWLQRQVTQHDVGMLFLSGHGDNNAELGYVYIAHNYSIDSPRKAAVSFKEFNNTLNNLAGKAVFFIDTCHSGNVLGEKKRSIAKNADATGAINDLLSAESGVVVFSASTGRQVALEQASWGNGAFTKAVVEGLSGKADFAKKGFVSHKMLDFYISDRVKELTKGKQTPVTQAPGGVPDFPLAAQR